MAAAFLAAKIAWSAQTIEPTADNMALAFFCYRQALSAADAEYERKTGKATGDRL